MNNTNDELIKRVNKLEIIIHWLQLRVSELESGEVVDKPEHEFEFSDPTVISVEILSQGDSNELQVESYANTTYYNKADLKHMLELIEEGS